MMGVGAIANNVGDGKIAGTVEAGDDPPVKKKKRYIYGGKGSRKMWMPQISQFVYNDTLG